MMRICLIALGTLLGCSGQEAVPAPVTPLDPLRIAYVSQCIYDNGTRILLAHRFASDSYHFIINQGNNNELSTIRADEHGRLEIETNGGLGKRRGVRILLDWLLTQPFRAVGESSFANELRRRDVPACPGPYPFSP